MEAGAVIWSKTNFGPTGHQSSSKCSSSTWIHHCKNFYSLNASWKSSSVRVFSSTCESASITSVLYCIVLYCIYFGSRNSEDTEQDNDVSKLRSFSFIFNWGKKVIGGEVRWAGWVGDDSHVPCETVRYRDVTASSFADKVPVEVFAHLHA
jgi:hypothetical protein